MKKIILATVSLFTLISCNKEEDVTHFIMGNVDGMEVQEFNIVVQSIAEDPNFYQQNKEVDFQFDGVSDLILKSASDSNISENSVYHEIKMSLGDQYTIYHYTDSDIIYHTNDTTYDYYGTFPRLTQNHNYSWTICNDCIEENFHYKTPVQFEFGALVEMNSFSEAMENYPHDYFLFCPAYVSSYYNFSLNGDSLIGVKKTFPGLIKTPIFNEPFYIALKREGGTDIDYGWAEFVIEDPNKLTLTRAAWTKD